MRQTTWDAMRGERERESGGEKKEMTAAGQPCPLRYRLKRGGTSLRLDSSEGLRPQKLRLVVRCLIFAGY